MESKNSFHVWSTLDINS